jgi:hypothetical protein
VDLPPPAPQPVGHIVAVAARRGHHFSKSVQLSIRLRTGLGVEGDGHMGERVKHRSRARYDPTLPNLRQVHLIDTGFVAHLAALGFAVGPGDIGENMLVEGLELIALPTGTLLHIGDAAVLRVTGLRNPCIQMDRFMPGLMAASLRKDADGALVRLSGVMSVVEWGGDVRAGDVVRATLPAAPHQPLKPV